MKGVGVSTAAIIGLLAVLVVGYFLVSGGMSVFLAKTPSINEIISNDMGYMCRWEGIIHHYLGDVNAYAEYYFHGKKFKFVEKGVAGYTHYLDTDLTNPKAKVYQWITWKKDGSPFMVEEFIKEENPPENFDDILKIVYTERTKPFEAVLRDTLKKAEEQSKGGMVEIEIKSVKCGPWVPDEQVFTPPQTS